MELHSNPRPPDPDTWTGSLAGWVGVPRFTQPALCAEIGDDPLWFPDQGGSTVAAKAVCERCPAIAACLEWALEHDERHGVWGGQSPEERDAIRRKRGLRRVPRRVVTSTCGTAGGYASHLRRGERTCDRCREAQRVANRESRARREAS